MTDDQKRASSLSRIVTPDRSLEEIVGEGPMALGEVFSRFWDYVRVHGLQDQRYIIADPSLRPVFDGRERISMFDVSRVLKPHVGLRVARRRKKENAADGDMPSSVHILSNEASTTERAFPEGTLGSTLHLRRERNAAAVRAKKEEVYRRTGRLACECCGFDFHREYGSLGERFAECHHTIPVSAMDDGHETRLEEMAIVCANCHRMLHRQEPPLSIDELKKRRNVASSAC